MRRFIQLFVIILPVFGYVMSCSNTEEVIVNPPLVIEINTIIDITSFEKIEAGSTTFELRCLSRDLFPCANYGISHDLNLFVDSIDLEFTEISRPAICLRATAKAFGIVLLGTLANNTYEFPIRVNTDTVMAQLIVTDSSIEILGGNGTWTNFLRPNLRRIPEDIIWGQVGYNNTGDLSIANTYFDSLNNLGAVAGTLSTGSYGYFYVDSIMQADSILELGPSIGTTFRIPYVYHYSGDTASLQNLIQNFANQGNLVEVNVVTDEGYEYRSW